MIKFILGVIVLGLLVGCSTVSKTTSELSPTIFEAQYYQDLQRNIVRLHHLMQGTFIAHKGGSDTDLESWTVSEGDSVVLYNVPLGDVDKDGYWMYSYEFMTSLPDQPIYTSIKEIKQLSRDTFDVLYYKPKTEMFLKLEDVLNTQILNEKINTDSLVLLEKKVRYVKKSMANFIGYSEQYEDKEHKCLRQNTYDVSPNFYKVKAAFYDKDTQTELAIKKRPNLLVRRDMSLKVLSEIAAKN